ncbi:MAG: hypothetical protein HY075_12455 [Deltaproteobacteria bacterium]|nr:hypothetical protein [Deltaproteobacteria bacterium]
MKVPTPAPLMDATRFQLLPRSFERSSPMFVEQSMKSGSKLSGDQYLMSSSPRRGIAIDVQVTPASSLRFGSFPPGAWKTTLGSELKPT